MKVKRLKVGVRPLEEGLQEFRATLKALNEGTKVSRRTGVFVVSVEAMRQVLTEPRLTLLHTIRTRHPRSIAELAKLVGRDFKNVRSDVRVLSELGLVESRLVHGCEMLSCCQSPTSVFNSKSPSKRLDSELHR
jgi:predicted transcriptional regulator